MTTDEQEAVGPVAPSPEPQPSERDIERHLRAALTAITEPGELPIARRIAQEGVEATWTALRAGDRDLDPAGVRCERAGRISGAEVIERASVSGLRLVVPGDPEWPARLSDLDESLAMPEPVVPPLGLWVRGSAELDSVTAGSVAIVGARAATPYGDRTASDLAAALTDLGWTVVSGGAYGIDAAAHRGALAVGGSTVAVLACGADVAYPRSHAALLERIASSGAVVSELAPGMRPARSRFLLRNRLIAGLTAGTVVVEAARRSGALNTAGWADRLGRQVGAVPGPVTSSLSAGCHVLIRERGATLVSDAEEILDLIGAWGDDAAPVRRGQDRRLDHVSELARTVHDHMPAPPTRIRADVLADTAGCSVDEIDAALGELVAHELVDGEEGDTWVVLPA